MIYLAYVIVSPVLAAAGLVVWGVEVTRAVYVGVTEVLKH